MIPGILGYLVFWMLHLGCVDGTTLEAPENPGILSILDNWPGVCRGDNWGVSRDT